jgi:hypothetical protein
MKKSQLPFIICSLTMLFLGVMFVVGCSGGGSSTTPDTATIDNVLGSFPGFTPDPGDFTSLGIFETIPPDGATGIPPATSIIIFFNDEVDPSTVNTTNVQVTDDGSPVSGTFGGTFDAEGNTVLFFAPDSPFGANATVNVFLPAGGVTELEDDGSNGLGANYNFSFQTGPSLGLNASDNLGFEAGLTGYAILGDGTVLSGTQGEVGPAEGSRMAGITTGDQHISSGTALSSVVSFLISGTITVPQGSSTMSFDYDFISEEFDEFVEAGFDDFFVVAVIGPSGAYASLVTSVDIVGSAASIPLSSLGSIPLLVDDTSPGTCDHTNWRTVNIPNVSSLGSPLTVIFAVSDVGDSIYDTLVFIDNIQFN